MRTLKRLGRSAPGLYLALVYLFMYIPIVVVIAYSFNQHPKGIVFTGFTFEWYPKLFQNRQIMESFRNSLTVALWSCAIAAVIGTLGAVGLARVRFFGKGALENISTLPIMIPEIVLGMALMVTFALIGLPSGMMTLIIAHATFCIPYILLIVRARLVGLDPAYEEAARDLGAGRMRAFMTVVVPLIAPAVVSGVLLAFAMSMDDVIISFFVSGAESTTFPVYVYSKLKTDVPPSINAMCTVMLLVTFLAVALSQWAGRKRAE